MASAESGVVALPLVSLLLCTEQTIPEYFPIIKTMTPKIHSIEQPWVVFCMNAAFTGCVSASPRPLKTELLFWNLILTTENPRRHCGQAQRSFLSPWKSIKWGNSILLNSKLYTLQLGVKMSPRKKQYRIMSFPTNWRLYCLKLHVSFFCKRTLNILGLTLGRLYIADIPWQ